MQHTTKRKKKPKDIFRLSDKKRKHKNKTARRETNKPAEMNMLRYNTRAWSQLGASSTYDVFVDHTICQSAQESVHGLAVESESGSVMVAWCDKMLWEARDSHISFCTTASESPSMKVLALEALPLVGPLYAALWRGILQLLPGQMYGCHSLLPLLWPYIATSKAPMATCSSCCHYVALAIARMTIFHCQIHC